MTKENTGSQEIMDMLQKMSKSIIQIENKLNKLTPNQKTTTNDLGATVGRSCPKDIAIKSIEKPKLIISERTGKVYLPYTKEEVEYYKTCGYETEVEIAKRFFTIPLGQYKNFSKSRVRERI